jgi:hypothetical protein
MPRAIFFASLRCNVVMYASRFERRHRDVPKHLFATAASQEMFSEGEPVIVAGDESDEHDGLGAVVEQPVKRFERALAIVRKQMIAEFEVG